MPVRSTAAIDRDKIVIIDEGLCIGCGKCVELRPKRILYIDNASKKCKVSQETECDRLAGCQRMCPAKAIKIIR
jgi:NAD-dependent dihydropyrimidine dehydrogenase PreA subunit